MYTWVNWCDFTLINGVVGPGLQLVTGATGSRNSMGRDLVALWAAGFGRRPEAEDFGHWHQNHYISDVPPEHETEIMDELFSQEMCRKSLGRAYRLDLPPNDEVRIFSCSGSGTPLAPSPFDRSMRSPQIFLGSRRVSPGRNSPISQLCYGES